MLPWPGCPRQHRPRSRRTTPATTPRAAAVRLVRRKTGAPYSLTAFVRDAFTSQLHALADLHNNGKPIEPDEVPLEPGRLV